MRKGTPSVMTPDTRSGWITASMNTGTAPASQQEKPVVSKLWLEVTLHDNAQEQNVLLVVYG